jgi:hypothetical protein
MPKQRFFTVSTRIFTSLKEAQEQMARWEENEGLQQGSLVFEVIAAYKPALNLVKDNSVFTKKLEKIKKKGENGHNKRKTS